MEEDLIDSEGDSLWDGDSEDEEDNENQHLYGSPLDEIDEVLQLGEKLEALKSNGGIELHNFLMNAMGQEQASQLVSYMQTA